MSNFCYCTSRSRWQWCELSNFLVHPGLWSVLLGWDLGCVPQTEVTQMVFLLIKGVMQQKNEVLFNLLFTWAFSLYPCSAFLLPPPKCLFFLKKPIKQSKPKPVLEAQPSLPVLCMQKELEKGFCWWQKWFLVSPHPFSCPTLDCLLMCSGLEVRTSSSSLVNIWNRAAISNLKGGFENGSSLPYAAIWGKSAFSPCLLLEEF